jgi:DNA-binding transcriptional MerR regulator
MSDNRGIFMQLLHSTYTVTKECGISTRQLYYWELIGIIRPLYESFGTRRFRRYTPDDLEILKQVKALLDEGFTLQSVRLQSVRERISKQERGAA